MLKLLAQIFNWTEVWALFIPIIALARNKKQPASMQPVILYIFIALFINYVADVMHFRKYFHFPDWFSTNTYLYQAHSIIRLLLFSIFFIRLDQPFLQNLKRVIPFFFIVFVLIDFSFFEHFINYRRENGHFKSDLSNHLLAVEAALLLVYCLLYYLYRLQEESHEVQKPADFWIVTGLCIFIVPCLPIYLFYDKLILQDKGFATYIWKVPDLCYLIFCILIAKAFTVTKNV